MQLTEKQKVISNDPLYWEWFQRWWEKDFSFKNLNNHKTPDDEFLSDVYTISSENYLISFANRIWHPVHTPEHDLAGNINTDLQESQRYLQRFDVSFGKDYIVGLARSDLNIRKSYDYYHSTIPPTISSTKTPNFTRNCYWDTEVKPHPELAGDHKDLILKFQPSQTKNVVLQNTTFGILVHKLIGHQATNKISVIDSKALSSPLTVYARQLEIVNLVAEKLIVPNSHGLELVYKGNTKKLNIEITGGDNKTLNVHLSNAAKLSLFISNCSVFRFDLATKDLRMLCGAHNVFNHKLILKNKKLNIQLYDSVFTRGVDFTKSVFAGRNSLNGVSILSEAIFHDTTFNSGISFEAFLATNGSRTNSKIQNADFSSATFTEDKELSLNYCVYFNDVDFLDSLNFQDAKFNGVPKFHGAKIPSETIFDRCKESSEFKNFKDVPEERIAAYQGAYRALRQHMEVISNYSQAAEFGVLEMKAKQSRKDKSTVPRPVAYITKLYGILGAYGQSFLRSFFGLILVGIASIIIQLFLFASLDNNCSFRESNCVFDENKAREATWRGISFFVPPFTLFIKRSIEQEVKVESGLLLQLLSGTTMLLHALAASTFVFLIGLALKRRLQMR